MDNIVKSHVYVPGFGRDYSIARSKLMISDSLNRLRMMIPLISTRYESFTPKFGSSLGGQDMFPFAIELAIKSLWDCFHEHGTYDRRHNLHILFQSVHKNAMDVDAAKQAQKQARDLWFEFQSEKKIHHSGTLDDFLTAHAKDFVETRYYTSKQVEILQINDFALCFYCIVYPLAARDSKTLMNLASICTA